MNKPKRLLPALLGLLCGLRAPSAAAQARQPTHVACVGDSITAGTGASSAATNYPADLQGLFGSAVNVKNFGHGGATLLSTSDKPYIEQTEYTSATSFVAGAGASAVVDVIIMLGTNDSKPANWNVSGGGTQSQKFVTDYAALVDHFTGLATHPAVYLALPLSAFSNTYTISGAVIKSDIIPAIKQVAMQKGLATIDLNGPTAAHPEYLTDGVHPNDNGYTIVAQLMHDGLLRVPQVTLSAVLAGAVVNLTADASAGNVPISSVQFLLGTTAIGTAAQAPYSASWTSSAPGSYQFSAKVTDKTGAAATSASLQVSVTAGAGNGGASGSDGGLAAGGAAGNGGSGGSSGSGVVGSGGTAAAGADTGGAGVGASGASSAAAGVSAGGAGAVSGSAAGASNSAPANDAGCGCRFVPRGAGSAATLPPFLLLAVLGLRRARRRNSELLGR